MLQVSDDQPYYCPLRTPSEQIRSTCGRPGLPGLLNADRSGTFNRVCRLWSHDADESEIKASGDQSDRSSQLRRHAHRKVSTSSSVSLQVVCALGVRLKSNKCADRLTITIAAEKHSCVLKALEKRPRTKINHSYLLDACCRESPTVSAAGFLAHVFPHLPDDEESLLASVGTLR